MHFSTLPHINKNKTTITTIQTTKISHIQNHNLHQSIIKQPFKPLTKTTIKKFNKYIYNKINNNNFNNHNSHYSKNLINNNFNFPLTKKPNITQQLLNFTNIINTNIQKFFKKKKKQKLI